MSAFLALRDVCRDFESGLRRVSTELYSAKTEEPFEDVLAKRMKDLALYSSKLRLLQAKRTAETLQVSQQSKPISSTLLDYTEAATWKIIEQQVVKTITHSHVIKKLITTTNKQLDPELLEKKEKIITQAAIYVEKETQLRQFQESLTEKEDQLLEVRNIWDQTLCQMKDIEKSPENVEMTTGPLYEKLQNLVNKMELMRWLVAKLVTSRTSDYDWIEDPHRRLKALALARQSHTIQDYTEN